MWLTALMITSIPRVCRLAASEAVPVAHLLHPPRPPPVDRGLARGGLGLGGEGGGVGGVRAVRADQHQQDEGAKTLLG